MDPPPVALLKRAGAVPLGGPNTSELCMWSESHHHVDGIPRDPHHLERVPGGSSVNIAGLKAERRSPGSCQRGAMDTVSEPDPGLTMEPEDKSFDPRKTSHRRFALKSCNIVLLIFGLLSILLVSMQFSSVMPTEEEEEAPSITEFHSSTHVLPVGQTARYTCHAGGTPEPTVEWLHNGRPLERNSTVNQSEAWVERGFLFVRGGRYGVNTVCCMASNSAGTANHSAELLVFERRRTVLVMMMMMRMKSGSAAHHVWFSLRCL
ncbi:uncharacterized protein LOC132460715 [Gadus macrocephalus]|uniref:uncharacterized protein LOC132460715 n=1 Tax=Gadus macrocephalus TaxID=80720 RepID=UPI0028CB73E9|nr:uncharacterized protein LOC132460715 [Gadus macrocephalus]